MDVAPRAEAKRFLHDSGRRFQAQEKDLRVGNETADLPGGFQPIQLRQPHVEHDEVRLKFLRFLNGIESIVCFPNDMEFRSLLKF